VHIPKFRNGAGKVLANASTPDFSGTSDMILEYALMFQELMILKAYPKNPASLLVEARDKLC
jgi:hypothetical protein